MSTLVKNSSGEWIPTAGHGTVEFGASTVREFSVSTSGEGYVYSTVTFDTPMPDDDYVIVINTCNHLEAHTRGWTTLNKTANGFTFEVYSAGVGATWTGYAFKLHSVEGLETLENSVNKLTTVTSGSATLASGLSGAVTYRKIGRVVQLWINNVRNESASIAMGALLASGLPEPLDSTAFAVCMYPKTTDLIDITSDGKLRQTGMWNVEAGIGLFGTVTYISKT